MAPAAIDHAWRPEQHQEGQCIHDGKGGVARCRAGQRKHEAKQSGAKRAGAGHRKQVIDPGKTPELPRQSEWQPGQEEGSRTGHREPPRMQPIDRRSRHSPRERHSQCRQGSVDCDIQSDSHWRASCHAVPITQRTKRSYPTTSRVTGLPIAFRHNWPDSHGRVGRPLPSATLPRQVRPQARPEASAPRREVYSMPSRHRVTRRNALKLGAAATALPLVHIRTAGAAGKLKLALWDHWVPTGDAAMKKLVDALGREEQGRGGARFPHLDRQQDQHHHGRRGAGQDRPRRLRFRFMDGAAVRRHARSDGRRDAASHREVRQAGSRLRVSRRCQRTLAGGAGRLGFRAAARHARASAC